MKFTVQKFSAGLTNYVCTCVTRLGLETLFCFSASDAVYWLVSRGLPADIAARAVEEA